jgi:hypothetical protein
MKKMSPQEKWVQYAEELIPADLVGIRSENVSERTFALRGLYYGYRKLATLEWHLHQDSGLFRECMKKAITYRTTCFEECNKINPINRSNTSFLGPLFDSISTGDESCTKSFFIIVDDNYDYKTKPDAHPADWLYRCLVALVLGRNADQWDIFMEKLKKGYSVQKRLKLYPYALLLEAIWTKNETLFHEQIQIVADTHKKLTRSIFDDYEDKLLCLWGIALCNLAKMKGMKIEFDHPFIPKELI